MLSGVIKNDESFGNPKDKSEDTESQKPLEIENQIVEIIEDVDEQPYVQKSAAMLSGIIKNDESFELPKDDSETTEIQKPLEI